MKKKEYPIEHFIKLENEHYREGRIIVTSLHDGFSAEVDIVQIEGKKIWSHIGHYFGFESEHEATEQGIQRLVEFLRRF